MALVRRPSHASHNSRDSRIKMSAGEEMVYLRERRKEGEREGKLSVDVYGGLDISAKKSSNGLGH